ncbi:MAG: calcium/sodium antiporter [Spirochaetaceae bacterium]|nr:calcium/sodium antiporter [Spirochaetaceae bacterium]
MDMILNLIGFSNFGSVWQIILQIAILALGFVFLVKGADWFVDGAASIATKFGIPQLIIGLTIVAMGTSAPEAAVSITAAAGGNADITIGNVVGSNILNIFVILGLTALVNPVVVQKSSLIVDIPVVIGITAMIFVMGLDGSISRFDAVIMLIVFVSYLLYLIWDAKRSKALGIETNEDSEEIKNLSLPKSLIFTVIGLALIVAGSNCVVESATFIAEKAGLSERFIGLTIVALGTSLPELFTSVTAAMKKNSDIAVGNILGSNIFNILFVVGLSGLIIPVPFQSAFRFDTIVSGIAAILLLLFCLPKKRLSRVAGIIFLICYAVYFYMIW